MKRTVYFLQSILNNGNGDAFEDGFTFDLDQVRETAAVEIHHLTRREKETRVLEIVGYNLECEDGASAKDVYNDAVLADGLPNDPDYYEKISTEDNDEERD